MEHRGPHATSATHIAYLSLRAQTARPIRDHRAYARVVLLRGLPAFLGGRSRRPAVARLLAAAFRRRRLTVDGAVRAAVVDIELLHGALEGELHLLVLVVVIVVGVGGLVSVDAPDLSTRCVEPVRTKG